LLVLKNYADGVGGGEKVIPVQPSKLSASDGDMWYRGI